MLLVAIATRPTWKFLTDAMQVPGRCRQGRPLVPGLGFWPSSLSCQTLGMALGFWLRPDGRNGHTLPPVLARSTLEDMGPVLCTQASLGASQTYRSFVRHSPAHLLCPPCLSRHDKITSKGVVVECDSDLRLCSCRSGATTHSTALQADSCLKPADCEQPQPYLLAKPLTGPAHFSLKLQ